MILVFFILSFLGFQGCGQSQTASSKRSEFVLSAVMYKGIVDVKMQEGYTEDEIKKFKKESFLTPGSAFLTESGDLSKVQSDYTETNGTSKRGSIKYIIHAAPGARDARKISDTNLITHFPGDHDKVDMDFEPTIEKIKNSIKNALDLANKNNIQSVAIPLVGGKIFFGRINKGIKPDTKGKSNQEMPAITLVDLAGAIVDVALLNKYEKLSVKFVDYGMSKGIRSQYLLKAALAKSQSEMVVYGSGKRGITDFSLHGCDAIINAANIEGEFGGGISGIIGDATGMRDAIDAAVKNKIIEFYNKTRVSSFL